MAGPNLKKEMKVTKKNAKHVSPISCIWLILVVGKLKMLGKLVRFGERM